MKKTLSISFFYMTIFIVILACSYQYSAIDFDLWDRLVMGKSVIQTGKITNDIFSFAKTHTWYDPEWLSSALIYYIQSLFGLNGLIFLKAFLAFITFSAISIGIKLHQKNNPYNLIFYLILLFLSVKTSILIATVRCQLITFFFLAVWIILLEEVRKDKNTYLYLLPIFMLAWLNLHGGCICGVGILFLYMVGEFLNKKNIAKYIITFLFTLLVFLINPWGYEYIPFIIKSAYIDRSLILEWQSPLSGYLIKYLYFYIHIILFTLFCYISKLVIQKTNFKKIDKTKLLLISVLTFLSLSHTKHIWLFLVTVSILCYDDFCFFFNLIILKIKNYLQITQNSYQKIIKIKQILIYIFIAIFCLRAFIFNWNTNSQEEKILHQYPVYPLQFILKNNLQGNILAPFHISSFLAFKGYPNIKIYMDGRQEQVYFEDSIKELTNFYTWEKNNATNILKNNNIDYIILTQYDKATRFISQLSDYSQIYDDLIYVILAKNNLKKFHYAIPKKNEVVTLKNLFKTNIDFRNEKK